MNAPAWGSSAPGHSNPGSPGLAEILEGTSRRSEKSRKSAPHQPSPSFLWHWDNLLSLLLTYSTLGHLPNQENSIWRLHVHLLPCKMFTIAIIICWLETLYTIIPRINLKVTWIKRKKSHSNLCEQKPITTMFCCVSFQTFWIMKILYITYDVKI